jgi:hypothetical protein
VGARRGVADIFGRPGSKTGLASPGEAGLAKPLFSQLDPIPLNITRSTAAGDMSDA